MIGPREKLGHEGNSQRGMTVEQATEEAVKRIKTIFQNYEIV